MPRARNSPRSAEGKASAPTSAFFREEMSIFSSAARSSRIFKNDGVPTYATGRRSAMARNCCSVCPVRAAIGDVFRAHLGEAIAVGGRALLGGSDDPGQGCHQRRFAFGRVARLQRVVEAPVHARPPLVRFALPHDDAENLLSLD